MRLSRIPIANIYHMMCYAWRYFPRSDSARPVGGDDFASILDLMTFVLKRSTQDILTRGLHRSYVSTEQELFGLKGKLLVSPTLSRCLLRSGRTACETDEYTADILLNQVLASTIHAMLSIPGVSARAKGDLAKSYRQLQGVSVSEWISPTVFRRIQIDRHTQHYRPALNVCEFIWQQIVPTESGRRNRFESFLRDEVLLRRVFEDFVRNFLATHLGGEATVKSETLRLVTDTTQASHPELLPVLKTDTSVIRVNDSLVIETKFTEKTLVRNLANGSASQAKLRSTHLYQLLAYLETLRQSTKRVSRGVLLYPTFEDSIRADYKIWEFHVHIRTLDLARPWPEIAASLASIGEVS